MRNYLIVLGAVLMVPAVMASDLKVDPEDIKALQTQLRQEQESTERLKQTSQLKQQIADQQKEQQKLQSGEKQATTVEDNSDKSTFVQGRDKAEKEIKRVGEKLGL